MRGPARLAAAGAVALGAACALASCSGSPSAKEKAAGRGISTTTTTTSVPVTTSTAATTTTTAGVVVPNVIGLKIAAARYVLHTVGLASVGLNVACNKGTLASQSVVVSLSVAGKAPTPNVGAVPLSAGAAVPPGTRVGITWSGCYGNGSVVPAVVGLTFPLARHALHEVGLTWACYSVGGTTTTTRSHTTTTSATTTSASTTTSVPVTTTTHRPPQTVLTQNPPPGAVLKAGTTVALTMHACPQ